MRGKHFNRLRRAEMGTAYLFILPMFAGLVMFSVVPFIQNILYSFRKMGTFGEGTFVGLKNYRDLLTDDTFWLALKNTAFYAVVGVPLVIIFSIFLAHQINKKIRGRTVYRTLLFIPAVTIPAAIGILWRWILNYQYGIFNWILEKLGLPRISWLGDVKYVRWAIILVVVWSMVSYYVIIMLAAMQGIDSSYYEAARLDGANSRQVFFKITLPMLTPMIFFSVIMVTIGILQIFDFIYLMVDRQTLSYTYSMSLVTYFYECAFNKSSMRGYGAAISVVLAAIIMVITIIQMVGKSTGSRPASERQEGGCTMNKKRDRLNDESGFSRFATHAVLIFASFLAFGPFVWMFLTSIKTYEETIQIPMKFLPEVAQWVNYSIVSDKLNFPQLYLNTILVTIMMIIGQILIVTICAYAFDRLKFPGKNVLFMGMLALMMVPGQIFIIPRFKLMVNLGLTNTLVGLVLPGLFNIFGVFLMRQFFSTLPRELDEAALIDGCSYFRIYWNVLLPLVKPGLTTLAILGMLNTWKDLMWPLINNSQADKMTLAAGLAMLIGEHTTYYEQVMAGGVIAVLPLIVLFVIFQRQFVEGIAHSGIKG